MIVLYMRIILEVYVVFIGYIWLNSSFRYKNERKYGPLFRYSDLQKKILSAEQKQV